MKKNNKGFSLVELIIVIAIMAVLVGILAPQFLKFVHNSRISTDIQNADEMATAINVAIADGNAVFDAAGTTVDWTAVDTVTAAPTSKLGGTWGFVGNNQDGVTTITLQVNGTTYECYPNPEANPATGNKGINLTTANGGLKR